jgi:hypothetical protein
MNPNNLKRPPVEVIQGNLDSGLSRLEMAQLHRVHQDTISSWCAHYGLKGFVSHRERDVFCGKATIVALEKRDGEQQQYIIPGRKIIQDRNEAVRIAAIMNNLMSGRVNYG